MARVVRIEDSTGRAFVTKDRRLARGLLGWGLFLLPYAVRFAYAHECNPQANSSPVDLILLPVSLALLAGAFFVRRPRTRAPEAVSPADAYRVAAVRDTPMKPVFLRLWPAHWLGRVVAGIFFVGLAWYPALLVAPLVLPSCSDKDDSALVAFVFLCIILPFSLASIGCAVVLFGRRRLVINRDRTAAYVGQGIGAVDIWRTDKAFHGPIDVSVEDREVPIRQGLTLFVDTPERYLRVTDGANTLRVRLDKQESEEALALLKAHLATPP